MNDILKTASVSAVSAIMMSAATFPCLRSKEMLRRKINLVGSEEIYTRVTESLEDGIEDPFFYKEQLKLFIFRERIIVEHLMNQGVGLDQNELANFGYLLCQGFNPPILVNLWLGIQNRTMFSIPSLVVHTFLTLLVPHNEYELCSCEECQATLGDVKVLLAAVPGSAEMTERAIRTVTHFHLHPVSLKEICMKRVMELGLDQDSLPLTLKKRMERGPEKRELKTIWQKVVMELENIKILQNVDHEDQDQAQDQDQDQDQDEDQEDQDIKFLGIQLKLMKKLQPATNGPEEGMFLNLHWMN